MFRDGPERLFVFRLGTERFALAMSLLDEVIELPPVQPMPDTGNAVLGIAALRGALVTVYDPRPVLTVSATVDGAALLFTRAGRRIALAVDDVYDVIVVERSELRAAPGVGSDRVLLGVIHHGDDLIAVLDGNALLDAAMVLSQGAAA